MPRKPALSASPALIEKAIIACIRLDSAVLKSPVRHGWLQRSRINAAARMTAGEGDNPDPDRLMAAFLQIPFKARADAGAAARGVAWLETWLALGGAPPAEPRPPVAEQVREVGVAVSHLRAAARSGRGGVFRALPAGLAAAQAAGVPGPSAFAAIPAFLASVGVIAQAWPGLAPLPEPISSDRIFAQHLLMGLEQQATHELRQLEALEKAWASWQGAIADQRSNSRLPRLLHLVASFPALGSVFVAKRLSASSRSCTVPGASFMLDALVKRGILVEASGRRSWRRYVPADLAHLQGRSATKQLKPGQGMPAPADVFADARPDVSIDGLEFRPLALRELPSVSDTDWEALLAEIDSVNRRAKDRLKARTV